jgi:putative flippase GtrA
MQNKYLNKLRIKYISTKILIKFTKTIESMHLRYLIAGAWNTAFGYFLANLLYYTLQHKFHLISISIFSNILAITMSFLTYKILVFKTNDNWLLEYRKFCMLYGTITILGISLLWVLVDLMGIPFWIGQAFILLMSVILLYIGNSKFTFVNSRLAK